MRLLRLLIVLLALGASWPLAAEEDPFAGLSSQSFDEVAAAVGTLAASGAPRAAVVIAAMQNDALYADEDGHLYIQSGDDWLDALTGAKAADVDADALGEVRINNAVRRAISAAMGSLDLFSPDASTRARAAAAVLRAHDPAVLPGLDKALASEKNASVARAMREARAAVVLAVPDSSDAERLAAIGGLRERGDIEARGLLAEISGASAPVATAAHDAIVAIDRSQQIWGIAQSVFYGLSLGSVLLLAAAGLAITFGVMGVINMAHGEMVMLGAYTTFTVQEVLHSIAPGLMAWSLPIAVPLAFLVSGLVGIVIERGLIRFLYGRPLETLLATWGLSLVLQQAVRSIFGASNRDVLTPAWMSGAAQWGGLTITWNRLVIILFAALVLAALMAALRWTSLGLSMRAVTQNRRMAAAMGIRTPWIDALTFGLGSGVAGIAGVALSQIDNVSPNLGQGYIIDSFMVVVFGGVGNLWGTLVSALTLGIVNKFLEPIAGAVLGKIVVLVLLILFIQRKPRGMFPLKGRAAES